MLQQRSGVKNLVEEKRKIDAQLKVSSHQLQLGSTVCIIANENKRFLMSAIGASMFASKIWTAGKSFSSARLDASASNTSDLCSLRPVLATVCFTSFHTQYSQV